MLSEIIFVDKRIIAAVPVAVGTWELRNFVPVLLVVVKASKGHAASTLKGVMVEGFRVTLKFGT